MFYLQSIHEDKLLWNCYSREPKLVRESDLLPDDIRLNSRLYQECYQGFHIYDSLQYKTNEEISDALDITVNTLQKHIQNIFRKTNTTSKWELLRLVSDQTS